MEIWTKEEDKPFKTMQREKVADQWDNLANAIILKAAQDYHRAKAQVAKNPKNITAQRTLDDCKRFFLSEWYTTLTRINGRWMLNKLDELYEEQGVIPFTVFASRGK